MDMYKMFLDGIQIFDAPKGLDEIDNGIVREDGFSNTEQVIRQNITSVFTFNGDGYRYLCQKKKINNCSIVKARIIKYCNNGYARYFDGTIQMNWIKFNHTTCTAETQIRDGSFSSYIKDYTNTEIPLFNTKTKNCEQLLTVEENYEFGINYNSSINGVNRIGFDVLKVFQYLISYATDNKITVVSNYLQSNKIGISTGYSLRNGSGSYNKRYPIISFKKLFDEVRKKHRIYMSIDNTNSGAVLNIEHEDNFYSNVELMTFDDLPYGLTEEMDKSKIFNSIQVGSENTKLNNSANDYYFSGDELYTWDKKIYTACSGCTADADGEQNKLDLISSFIIDSDMIYEQLNTSDDTNDSNIYMYDIVEPTNVVKRDLVGSVYLYNVEFQNKYVVDRWLGATPQCMAESRFSKYGFKAVNGGYNLFEEGFSIKDIGGCTLSGNIPATHWLGCVNEIYDFNNCHSTNNDFIGGGCTTGGKKSLFECKENGTYGFHAFSDIKCYVISPTNTDDLVSAKFQVRFVVFQDNTLTTQINATPYVDVFINNNTGTFSFDIESGDLPLLVGNIVMVETTLTNIAVVYGGRTYDFIFFNSIFELLYDTSTCSDLDVGNANSYGNLIEFSSPICYDDFKNIADNKTGFIRIKGHKYYIRSLRYKNGLGEFKLIGNNTLCEC